MDMMDHDLSSDEIEEHYFFDDLDDSSDSEFSLPGARDFVCPFPLSYKNEERLLQTTKINQSTRKNLVPLETLAIRKVAKNLELIYDSTPDMISYLPNGMKTLILDYFCSMHNPETLKFTYFPQDIKKKLPLHLVQALISGHLKQFNFAVCELNASHYLSENPTLLSIWECLATNSANLREVCDFTSKCLSIANIMQYLEKCEHLETLKLKFYKANDADIEMIGIKLPSLEELDLCFERVSTCGLEALQKLKNLHKIHFGVVKDGSLLKDSFANNIFALMPDLQLINYHDDYYPHSEYCPINFSALTQPSNLERLGVKCHVDFQKIPAIFPNLKHISIGRKVNKMLLQSIIPKLSHLQSLQFSMSNRELVGNFVMPTLELVGTRITNLSLDFENFALSSNLKVSSILEFCPTLESLKLAYLRCGEPQIFSPLKLKLRSFNLSSFLDSHALFVPLLLLQSPFLEEAKIDSFSFDQEVFQYLDKTLDSGHIFRNLASLSINCESPASDVTDWFRDLLAKIVAASPKLNLFLFELLPYASHNGYGYDHCSYDEMEVSQDEFNEKMECFCKAIVE